jgi:hypothetical protein
MFAQRIRRQGSGDRNQKPGEGIWDLEPETWNFELEKASPAAADNSQPPALHVSRVAGGAF